MKTKSTQVALCIVFLLTAFTAHAQNWLTTGNTGTTPSKNFLGTKDNSSLVIKTSNLERMRITSTGKIGIGTQAPRQRLDVKGGAINADSGFYINNSKVLYSAGDLILDAHYSTVDIGDTNQDATGLAVFSGASGIVGVANVLGVGVGGMCQSTDPRSYGIGVLGNSYASTGFGGDFENTSGTGAYCHSDSTYGIYAMGGAKSYAGYFNGGIYATGIYSASDETLKQNIEDFASAMDIIKQLHPKQYQYRQDDNYKLMKLPQGEHYGLIAQDVEKVLPGLIKDTKFSVDQALPHTISFDPKSPGKKLNFQVSNTGKVIDFKALNYTELIPILVKGMQEQQQSIEDLKQINQQQQQQINQLKNLLESKLGVTTSSTLSSASLLQNAPNPCKNNTKISYNLPAKFSSAQIIVTDNSGKVLKQINVTGIGKGSINIAASSLAAGNYNYSLWIDGRLIDTKQMLLQK